MLIGLILMILDELLTTQDGCAYLYVLNVMYALQTCQSVFGKEGKLMIRSVECMIKFDTNYRK